MLHIYIYDISTLRVNLGTGMRRAASLMLWSLISENGNLMNPRARLIVRGKHKFVPIPGTKSRFIGRATSIPVMVLSELSWLLK